MIAAHSTCMGIVDYVVSLNAFFSYGGFMIKRFNRIHFCIFTLCYIYTTNVLYSQKWDTVFGDLHFLRCLEYNLTIFGCQYVTYFNILEFYPFNSSFFFHPKILFLLLCKFELCWLFAPFLSRINSFDFKTFSLINKPFFVFLGTFRCVICCFRLHR